MTAAAGVPPAGAARIVRVEERARFRCARCGRRSRTRARWYRTRCGIVRDASNAPVEEEHHRDGGVTGARGGPTRGHPSGVRRGNDVAGALTHAQRDLLREGEQLMRRLDTVRASTSFSSPSSSSSMGRLHDVENLARAEAARGEGGAREARRHHRVDVPDALPDARAAAAAAGNASKRGGFDEEKSHEKGEDDKALETVAPPRRPRRAEVRVGGSRRAGRASHPGGSSPHEAETIRYRDDDDDDDDASPSSASSSTASFDSTIDAGVGGRDGAVGRRRLALPSRVRPHRAAKGAGADQAGGSRRETGSRASRREGRQNQTKVGKPKPKRRGGAGHPRRRRSTDATVATPVAGRDGDPAR